MIYITRNKKCWDVWASIPHKNNIGNWSVDNIKDALDYATDWKYLRISKFFNKPKINNDTIYELQPQEPILNKVTA